MILIQFLARFTLFGLLAATALEPPRTVLQWIGYGALILFASVPSLAWPDPERRP